MRVKWLERRNSSRTEWRKHIAIEVKNPKFIWWLNKSMTLKAIQNNHGCWFWNWEVAFIHFSSFECVRVHFRCYSYMISWVECLTEQYINCYIYDVYKGTSDFHLIKEVNQLNLCDYMDRAIDLLWVSIGSFTPLAIPKPREFAIVKTEYKTFHHIWWMISSLTLPLQRLSHIVQLEFQSLTLLMTSINLFRTNACVVINRSIT